MDLFGWLSKLSDALHPLSPTSTASTSSSAPLVSNNTAPIILVHGFAGQAVNPDGTKYWGRYHGDIAEKLRQQGHQVHTVSIGPFASNWDRACELYAQIKGGRVDYGEKHSAHHGHKRFGREYPGFFPQWGTVVNGQVQKVHLIGHSMGGPTSRMMAQLLAHGTKGAPVEENPQSHPLFSGGNDWVLSITTVVSPNQGSTLADGFSLVADPLEDALATWFSFTGVTKSKQLSVDAQLDQWDIYPRKDGETIREYIHRIMQSRMFAPGYKDIVAWSLSTAGSKEENKWVQTLPNVFYYSISTDCTEYKTTADGKPRYDTTQPDVGCISIELRPCAAFIASDFTSVKMGFPGEWQCNDGAVNTPSMLSDGHGPIIQFDGRSRAGHWMNLPHLTHIDHLTIIGRQREIDPSELYLAHAAILADLPPKAPLTEVVAPGQLVDRLQAAIEQLNDREVVDFATVGKKLSPAGKAGSIEISEAW
ncbi:hypothetical protein Poli38472_013705 [Pythium oligandrum]|uniref:Lipase-like C-terminal domain-containing protein n=1 Tax=Pythium oligandrum TaxID=41045 RepID=A0A8K1CFI4_PYTOL|nr:hypothetical protein Poli38472_013705 [Pythium oligandrum]|eukprot:TMW61242.1 hypothetical protein Poli38472_013705 [Pythium oligandrum]